MSSLIPIRFRTELARQFHRSITNTINVQIDERNSLTPVQNTVYSYSATAGQTTFTGPDSFDDGTNTAERTLQYTPGRIDVFLNGEKLDSTEYEATTGNSIVLDTACSLDDSIVIIKFSIFAYPNPSDYHFVFLGKSLPWNSTETVPTLVDTRETDVELRRNILSVKKIQPNDVSLLIPRINWESGAVYFAYTDTQKLYNDSLEPKNFYVMNSSFRVYKCLYTPVNPVSLDPRPSLVEPGETTAGPFSTSDGYFWQLMYEVPAADRIKFLTTDYIPIKFYSTSTTFDHNGFIDEIIVKNEGQNYTVATVLILGDGVGATAEAVISSGEISAINITNPGQGYSFALVQIIGDGEDATAEAVLRSVDIPITTNQDVASFAVSSGGGINFIEVENGGENYFASTTQIQIIGDGEGATAQAIIDPATGTITSVNVTDRGRFYTFADIVATGNGAGAILHGVIEPQGGHGVDLPKELLARVVGITVSMDATFNDFFLQNDFRQLGIIKNIKKYESDELFSDQTGNACYKIGVPDPTKYNLDDIIESDSGGKFSVVDKQGSIISLLPIIDVLNQTDVLENITTGQVSLPILSGIQNFTSPEFSINTGDIIYARNASPVVRDNSQVEQVKLYFKF